MYIILYENRVLIYIVKLELVIVVLFIYIYNKHLKHI